MINKQCQLESNNVFPVTQVDLEIIKTTAKQAIITSVLASPDEKQDIIANTDSHIDKSFKEKDAIFLKYHQKNEILGFIIIQQYWNLSDLFVSPKAHKRGIGKTLWATALQECIAKGRSNVVRVNSSLNAEDFYRKLGFIDYQTDKPHPNIIVPLKFNFPVTEPIQH